MSAWGEILAILISAAVGIYICVRYYYYRKRVFIHIFLVNLLCIAWNVIVLLSKVYVFSRVPYTTVPIIGFGYYDWIVIERWWIFTGKEYPKTRIAVHFLNGLLTLFFILNRYAFNSRFGGMATGLFYIVNGTINYGVNSYIVYEASKTSKVLTPDERNGYFRMLYAEIVFSFLCMFLASLFSMYAGNDFFDNITSIFLPLRILCEVLFQFGIQKIFDSRKNSASKKVETISKLQSATTNTKKGNDEARAAPAIVDTRTAAEI